MKKLITDLVFGIGGFLIVLFFFKNYYSIGLISIIGIIFGWLLMFFPEIYFLRYKIVKKLKWPKQHP